MVLFGVYGLGFSVVTSGFRVVTLRRRVCVRFACVLLQWINGSTFQRKSIMLQCVSSAFLYCYNGSTFQRKSIMLQCVSSACVLFSHTTWPTLGSLGFKVVTLWYGSGFMV
jgi:hypothetical protein